MVDLEGGASSGRFGRGLDVPSTVAAGLLQWRWIQVMGEETLHEVPREIDVLPLDELMRLGLSCEGTHLCWLLTGVFRSGFCWLSCLARAMGWIV